MNPIPSWLSNIINLLGPLALVIALVFTSVDPADTAKTAGLLEALLNNLWAAGLMAVQGVKAVIDSVKRWGQDNPNGLVASTFGIKRV